MIRVGKFKQKFNEILGVDMPEFEIYRSKGLPAHMINRKHEKCLKYIDFVPDIIESPDYIGINPNESWNASIELIKRYKDNVLIGIKLDSDNGYYYVSTMYDIQENKIKRRLHSGRLKIFNVDDL